jgi:hypothetical protein
MNGGCREGFYAISSKRHYRVVMMYVGKIYKNIRPVTLVFDAKILSEKGLVVRQERTAFPWGYRWITGSSTGMTDTG